MADVTLQLFSVPVIFSSGSRGQAVAEGLGAAWQCRCDRALPLIGRAYFQFGHTPHTVCPDCERSYRVERDADKRTCRVVEA